MQMLLGNSVLRTLGLFHFTSQEAFQIVPVDTPFTPHFQCGNKALSDHLADLLFCRLQQCGGLCYGQQFNHAQGPSSFWLLEFFLSSWYSVW